MATPIDRYRSHANINDSPDHRPYRSPAIINDNADRSLSFACHRPFPGRRLPTSNDVIILVLFNAKNSTDRVG
jgi:hypothetical protein